MTFADIVFRVGVSIGGWLVFVGHGLTISVLPRADCDPASDAIWRGTLVLAAVSALALLFVGRGLPWRGTLRWVAAPAACVTLLAGRSVLHGLATSTIGSEPLCAMAVPTRPIAPDATATALEAAWPVAQLLVLGFGLAQAARFFRPAPDSDAPDPARDARK